MSASRADGACTGEGRSAAEVAQDEAHCEAYGKGQPKHHGDHYQACMITRGYATNWDMDELGWIIGVVQTRPHDAATVMTDLAACDRQADNAKSATVVPPLTPAQESVIGGQARGRGFEGYHRRPTATRMLVSCLQGRGYAVTPWVPMNAPREYGLQLVTTAKALGLTIPPSLLLRADQV